MIIRNLGWAALNHGVGRAAIFVFFLLLPLLMDVDEVGQLTFIYTVILLLFQPILDTAIGTIIVKNSARGQWQKVKQAVRFLRTGLLSAAIGVVVIAILVSAQSGVVLLLGGAVLGAIGLNAVFSWRRGLDDFRMEGTVGSFQKIAALIALAFLAFNEFTGPTAAATAMFFGVASAWILAGVAFKDALRQFQSLSASGPLSGTSTMALLREGIVIGAVGVVGFLYLRVDVVMLGLLSGKNEVGFYFTAARILEASFIVPHIVMLVVFPRLARKNGDHRFLRRTTIWLGLGGLLAAFTLAAVGQWAIPKFYGADWIRSGEILTLLSLAAPMVFLGYVMTQALIAADLQERYLLVALAGLILNIGLNVLLIPFFGGIGAAGATVMTELLVTAGAAMALVWKT